MGDLLNEKETSFDQKVSWSSLGDLLFDPVCMRLLVSMYNSMLIKLIYATEFLDTIFEKYSPKVFQRP